MSEISFEDNFSDVSSSGSGTPNLTNPTSPSQTPESQSPSHSKDGFIQTVLTALSTHQNMVDNKPPNPVNKDPGGNPIDPKIAAEKKTERAAASLRAAAAGGFAGLVELLLDKYRDGNLPAVSKERYITHFLNGKDKDGNSPLYHAAFVGHAHVVEILLDEPGVEVNAKNERGWTPLRAALGTDNADAAELLAEEPKVVGTKAHHRNWNPLCHASAAGHIHVVRLLLDREGVRGEIDEQDGDGMTALYLAASNGHLRVVKRLLDKGANPNKESKGFLTPLYGAALGGHTRIVQLLLKQSSIERASQTFEGDSPLDAAVKGGHTKIADILMDAIAKAPASDKSIER